MRKGEVTRESIIEKAAPIFNKRGFAGASMAELMQVTGLKKGGIYNHFKTKEDIIFEAFDHAVRKIKKSVYAFYKNENSDVAKLKKIIKYYETYPLNPPIEGGCPIVNTAIDSDNTHPELKKKVKEVLEGLIEIVRQLVQSAIEKGELKSFVNAKDVAVVIVTTIHGGIVISRSLDDSAYMEIVCKKLIDYIDFNLVK